MLRRVSPVLILSCAFASTVLLGACGDGGTNGIASTPPTATQHGWGVVQAINSETYNADLNPPSNPQVRFTAQGGAVAIWVAQEQHGLTNDHGPAFISQIHAARYVPNVGWGSEHSIDIQGGGAAGPQLESDADGNALAVWVEGPDTPQLQSLYVNRFSASDGWGNASSLASDGEVDIDPQVAFDPAGNAFAVWTAFGRPPAPAAHPPQTYVTRYVNGRGWVGSIDDVDNCGQAATAYANDLCDQAGDGVRAYHPQLKFDAEGNAIAVWAETNLFTRTQKAYANRYSAATGAWGAPKSLSDDFVDGYVHVAVDHSGNAWAIWPSNGQVHVAGYAAGADWGAAQSIGTYGSFAGATNSQQVAVDSSGNAMAVWTTLSNETSGLYASRYTPAGGWGSPVRIDCADSNPADAAQACPGGVTDPQIAFDAAGNAFAVWCYTAPAGNSQTQQIYANRYALNKGWDMPQSIDIKAGLARSPQITVAADGTALAIWAESGKIYANRFD